MAARLITLVGEAKSLPKVVKEILIMQRELFEAGGLHRLARISSAQTLDL